MNARNSKLVAPAIVRKLDPSIGGVAEALLDLESVSLPRFQIGFPPQRLTMTLLGEFWVGRTEAIASVALVRLLGAFDINEQAARVALGRLAARGALIMERRGRTTWYRQSPNLLHILPQGRAITAGFGEPRTGWDGTWTIVTWSMSGGTAAAAHRVRLNLRELGFTPLNPGVWVSPDQPFGQLADAFAVGEDIRFTVLTARDTEIAGSTSPRSTWDPQEFRHEYDSFIELFQPDFAAVARQPVSPSDALVIRTRAVYRWFVIATLDPDLPVELLPADWPRADAHRLFVALVNHTTPIAASYVRSVLAESAPELAELVTTPPPYGG